MKNTIKISLLVIITTLLIGGCTKENVLNNNKDTENYVVNIDEASSIANQVFSPNTSFQKSTNTKKIKNQKTFLDKDQLPYFHILNLEDETGAAFVIVSGDVRTRPILAYSDNNMFPLDTLMPLGVTNWMQTQMTIIDSLRDKHSLQSAGVKKLWTNVILPGNETTTTNLKNEPIEDPNDCTGSYSIIKGPLLTTTWNQGCVYNEQCPSGCDLNICYHKPTGCVATAMAQVLKYWHNGTTYN
jgi:hypothetical protein